MRRDAVNMGSMVFFDWEKAMKKITGVLTAVLACCLFMLGGCQDKHEPVKPTVFQPVPAA